MIPDKGIVFRDYSEEEGVISFTCDGDCTNDNITFHINSEEYGNERWGFELDWNDPPILEIFTARDYIQLNRNLCDCKESIIIKEDYSYSTADDYEYKCRVWECFFKNNSLGQPWLLQERPTFSFEDKLLKVGQYMPNLGRIQRGYPVSIYLQGSKTVFRGGTFNIFCITVKITITIRSTNIQDG